MDPVFISRLNYIDERFVLRTDPIALNYRSISLPRPEPIVFELDNRNAKVTEKILELEQQHTDQLGECDICMESDAKTGYVLEPCLHNSVCITCIKKLRVYRCPFCRSDIEDVRIDQ